MSKWSKIVVNGIDNNGPHEYPLDDKEKNVIKFPRRKKRVALYKNYYLRQKREEEEEEIEEIPKELIEVGVQTEERLDVGVQTEKVDLPNIDELLNKL